MAVLRIQALALLLPPLLAHATFSPKLTPIPTVGSTITTTSHIHFQRPSTSRRRCRRRRRGSHDHDNNGILSAFLLPSSSSSSTFDHYRRWNNGHGSTTTNNKKGSIASTTTTIIAATFQSNDESYCYLPPYGMVPRSSSTTASNSAIVLNMSPVMMGGGGIGGGGDYPDDRFRKKMNSKRTKDPVVQDFGSMRDWQASKTGLGRLGDDKVGDDRVSEMFGGPGYGGGMMYEDEDRFDLMERRMPPMGRRNGDEEMMFEGDGGNYWVNPTNSMDRYPRGDTNEGRMMPRRSRGGGRGGNRRRRQRDMDDDDVDGEWWETRSRDDELFDDDADDYEEYGIPPPTRSRSSFRSGAPPPPRPVKSFYDKLFWFGFDPDVTQPTDRTMFGGTRGKFNAMDMLRDREERQRMRGGGIYGGGGRGGGGPRRRSGKPPVIQDFGSVGDWNAQKQGGGRAGGAAVGDDRERPYYGYEESIAGGGMGGPIPFPGDVPPMPPPGMPEYDFEPRLFDEDLALDDADMDFEGPRTGRRRRRDRDGRRRSRESRRRNMDSRALEYDRFLAGGGGRDEYAMDDEYPTGSVAGRPPPRRRRGYAYKYDQSDLMDFDDGEFIDIEPKYATKDDLDMAARGETRPSSASVGRRRRRSWEERAVEMDRVPPRGAVAWGPEGRIASGENPLDRAAMEALEDIRKSKRYLEKKERMVEDAKEEVVNLKSDASFCENQLEESRGGREMEKLEQELGYIIRDVEDASRNLRLARAEMEDAANRVRDLEERNWALLSEYEAGRSFEEELMD